MACFPAKRVRASINYFNQQYKLLCLPLFSVTYFLDSGLTPMWCVSKNFYETRVFLHILNPPVIILPLPRRQFLPISLEKKYRLPAPWTRLPAHLSIWISLPQILEDPPMNQLKCFLHPKPQLPPTINKSASRVSAAKTQTR